MMRLAPFQRLKAIRGINYLLAILVTVLFTLIFLPFRTEEGQDHTILSLLYLLPVVVSLEDNPFHPQIIRNEPGIGYRFMMDD